MLGSLLVMFGSYVIGAVPVAYLAGRLLKGIDLREHGSGNIGPSNVWQSVSKPAVVPVGLAEIAQGMAGPLAARRLGKSRFVQVVCGLAALVGHIWSPFLNFTGGRGIGHALGFMLAVCRPALTAFVAVSLAGVALRRVPECVGLGILAAPVVALARRAP
ncbi:MAG: glycerol-3-phosphate acyltransferase, partial [Dehalococcoidia bacterium]|nr:glycerol-3-phosphate acyltransferase [Dehalococcoidia bacterium]